MLKILKEIEDLVILFINDNYLIYGCTLTSIYTLYVNVFASTIIIVFSLLMMLAFFISSIYYGALINKYPQYTEEVDSIDRFLKRITFILLLITTLLVIL